MAAAVVLVEPAAIACAIRASPVNSNMSRTSIRPSESACTLPSPSTSKRSSTGLSTTVGSVRRYWLALPVRAKPMRTLLATVAEGSALSSRSKSFTGRLPGH